MNLSARKRFGKFEKPDTICTVYCTPKEKWIWETRFKKGNLSAVIRKLLDQQVLEGKPILLPSRPAYETLTARVRFKCTRAELWYWSAIAPSYGNRNRLPTVVAHLLNRATRKRTLPKRITTK